MTCDEAAEKWCPFARAMERASTEEGIVAASINRVDGNDAHIDCRCIANECMAWRWSHPKSNPPDIDIDSGYCGMVR